MARLGALLKIAQSGPVVTYLQARCARPSVASSDQIKRSHRERERMGVAGTNCPTFLTVHGWRMQVSEAVLLRCLGIVGGLSEALQARLVGIVAGGARPVKREKRPTCQNPSNRRQAASG